MGINLSPIIMFALPCNPKLGSLRWPLLTGLASAPTKKVSSTRWAYDVSSLQSFTDKCIVITLAFGPYAVSVNCTLCLPIYLPVLIVQGLNEPLQPKPAPRLYSCDPDTPTPETPSYVDLELYNRTTEAIECLLWGGNRVDALNSCHLQMEFQAH
jgi:hypothetical protein